MARLPAALYQRQLLMGRAGCGCVEDKPRRFHGPDSRGVSTVLHAYVIAGSLVFWKI